jgi:hypothetical protein
MCCPYASTRTVSNKVGEAFPLRIDPNSLRELSSAFSMAVRVSFRI